jgi:hypothetical protein
MELFTIGIFLFGFSIGLVCGATLGVIFMEEQDIN